jgi:hypothetical protein
MKTKHRQAAQSKRKWQADPMACMRLFRKFQPFTPADVNDIVLPPMLAWDLLRNGKGIPHDFGTVADTINVALARSEHIDALCVETCNLAIQGLLRAHERHQRIGRYGFDGPALQDIALALDLFHQIVQLGTPHELFDAIRRVKERIRAGESYELEVSV